MQQTWLGSDWCKPDTHTFCQHFRPCCLAVSKTRSTVYLVLKILWKQVCSIHSPRTMKDLRLNWITHQSPLQTVAQSGIDRWCTLSQSRRKSRAKITVVVQFSEFSHSVHSFRPLLQHTDTSGATKHQIGFSKKVRKLFEI